MQGPTTSGVDNPLEGIRYKFSLFQRAVHNDGESRHVDENLNKN